MARVNTLEGYLGNRKLLDQPPASSSTKKNSFPLLVCECYWCFLHNTGMGQQISGRGVMNQLRQKLEKCLELLCDSRFLTYEEFLGRLAELNDM